VRLRAAGGPHLTYCTNIHPGESWPEVRRNVGEHVASVKRAVQPGAPMGVGLRLSAEAAAELAQPREIASFRAELRERGLYVFTINGFPYGAFHKTRVKEAVYLPDWLDDARLAYTVRLAEILASLLPDEPGLTGTVSTVPGAFRERVGGDEDAAAMGDRIVRAAAAMHAIRQRRGKTIVLALEPEPFCCFETVAETVAYFEEQLFCRRAVDRFVALAGTSRGEAEQALRRHLGVCFDACHMAVEFEEPRAALASLAAAGIAIGKIQISAGLEVAFTSAAELAPLRAFADDVYLHQVVESGAGGLRRYLDLPGAIDAAHADRGRRVWRVHFHVPVFRDRLGPLRGTQAYLRELFALLRESPASPHLEVETYTWDVLPEEHRREGVVSAIARELHWVRGELERPCPRS
jgi:sugar phosphate isomerase/epimerase